MHCHIFYFLDKMAKVDLKARFFDFDEQERIYKCKIPGCRGKIQDKSSSLKRHVAQQHPDIAEKIGITGYKRKNEQQSVASPSPAKRLKTVTLQVDPVKFHAGIIQMVSEKSISFNFFNSQASRNTIGVLAKSLNIPVYGEAVASSIPGIAKIIRTMIADDLQKLFCLEFDGAARHNRKIFGINARYFKDGKIQTRTLSMMEMTEKQTAQNLKTVIEGVLAKYQTDITHVYSCTSDNGRNMIKCGQELRIAQEVALSAGADEGKVDDDNIYDESEDEDEEENDIAIADAEIDEMLDSVESIFLNGNESCISTVKCAAHTVNLVVKDVVNPSDEFLKKVRSMVKACRKIEYQPFFSLNKVALPKIDVETRWGSQFDMLTSVESKKEFFEDMGQKFPDMQLTEDDWAYIAEYTEAFEPLYALTKAVQSGEMILGDLFKLLKICQLKLGKVTAGNRFLEDVKAALERRSKVMMDNDAFRAAMLFDQRWCFIDSPYMPTEDKLSAIVSKLLLL